MSIVTLQDLQFSSAALLDRVEAGERLVVSRGGRFVAELRPLSVAPCGPRPFGLAAGAFAVPDDFDAPLPDDILRGFEGEMRLLLDTHVFLWYIAADPRLPATIRAAVQDPDNEVYLSAASVREAVIKHGIGKLPLPAAPAEYLPEQRCAHGIAPLPIDEGAMPHLATLPPLHRDPFDRLLVAQALQHGLTLATVDPEVLAYPVPVLSGS